MILVIVVKVNIKYMIYLKKICTQNHKSLHRGSQITCGVALILSQVGNNGHAMSWTDFGNFLSNLQ